MWIVSYCQVYLQPNGYRVDEMVAFLATSKASLRRFLNVRIADGTWWSVETGRLDEIEEQGSGPQLYSSFGKPIASAPVKRGYRAAIASLAWCLEVYKKKLQVARKSGRPKREISKLERAIEGFRWCLRGQPKHLIRQSKISGVPRGMPNWAIRG